MIAQQNFEIQSLKDLLKEKDNQIASYKSRNFVLE